MPEGKLTDVVLDPSQCVHIIDATKGTVECHVGPCRLDLAEKDRPVKFDGEEYQRCSVAQSVQSFPVAAQGDYIVLTNPAKDNSHPMGGKVSGAVDLIIGRSVVIPGPASFALWPGQVAKVVTGHQLRSNQYLVTRVINEEDAQSNWGKVVMTPSEPVSSDKTDETGDKTGDKTGGKTSKKVAVPTPAASSEAVEVVDAKNLTMGKELVIKGTDVSFFIPPTGMAVVVEQGKSHVRDAVTLETVEYCVLRREDGAKRYVRGPAVVFPEPTEVFVTTTSKGGKTSRKFRAVELNEISGIHVKVIADYAEGQKDYKEGDELFITGKEQRIYFPRPEHAIIKYGTSERHFAVAIPEGEARYVLDRLEGKIETLKGPKMALLDPTKDVFVRRVLDEKTVELWFPNNETAKAVNAQLTKMKASSSSRSALRGSTRGVKSASFDADYGDELVGSSGGIMAQTMNFAGDVGDVQQSYAHSERAVDDFGGDEIKRKGGFTPPRTVTLDTKYEGAVTVRIWTGSAVQIVSSTGKREVVVGPYPRILDYDEMLEIISLSTSGRGESKNFHSPLRTPYLRVKNNRVSDVIKAQTSDLVDVTVNVSYRVNFEGEKDKWFNVENYVGLLCERCRSILRGKIKKMSIRDFMADSVAIVRDALLGAKPAASKEAKVSGDRTGLRFSENDMHLYDVEVLDTRIGNSQIAVEIESAQHEIVTNEIGLEKDKQRLDLTLARQRIQQEINDAEAATRVAAIVIERSLADEEAKTAEEASAHALAEKTRKLELTEAIESVTDKIANSDLARKKAKDEQALVELTARKKLDAETLEKETAAFKTRMESIAPGLIAALQVHGDKVLTADMVKELGAVAALTGDSVEGVYKRLMKGSVLADVFTGNGDGGTGIAGRALRRAGLVEKTS